MYLYADNIAVLVDVVSDAQLASRLIIRWTDDYKVKIYMKCSIMELKRNQEKENLSGCSIIKTTLHKRSRDKTSDRGLG